jgi:acetyl-CoA carboxylase carboxyltransferase component
MKKEYDVAKQHSKGKLHAMERINLLLDKDTFQEIGSRAQHSCTRFGMEKRELPYDGVITGFGTVNGKPVAVYSQDFTVMGGTLGEMHGKKIARIIQLAIDSKCPIIGINDSGGARIQEGIHSLAGYGDIFRLNTLASGYIPQISVIVGPCAGGAVYSPGITDFVFMVDSISHMFVTGPNVVKKVLYQEIDKEALGGAQMHATVSGVCHFRDDTE